MRLDNVLSLKRNGAARPLSECIRQIGTAKGRKQLADVLAKRPFPHYEEAPNRPGYLVRIDKDGTRTVGRFENRQFISE